jgi:serine phosphatase RsbU (regulator of sigma subunit)
MEETKHENALPAPQIVWGVAARALPGQGESGDRHLLRSFSNGLLIGVVDGLGHGAEAAIAADLAIATLEVSPHEPVISLLKRCHEALKSTRGVVISLASFNAHTNTLSWISVGNVEGVLLRAAAVENRLREYVLPRGGVVGYRLPPLQVANLTIHPGDTLIFATDGIHTGFAEEILGAGGLSGDAPPQRIADHILATYGKDTDDALVLVVRFLGEAL